jgi:hypothetical protein
MDAIDKTTMSSSPKKRMLAMHLSELWNSVDKLGTLITAANWGIAFTLLIAFACTVVAVKATSRKDALNGQEDLRKAAHIAEIDAANLALRGKVATLETSAAGAMTGMAQLQKDAATQQERAAKAELSLLELQQKLNWREISSDQRKRFIAAATGKRKGLVTLIALSGDAEAKAFAEKLQALLKEAGWDSGPVQRGLFISPVDVGISIAIVSDTAPTRISDTLVSIPANFPVAYGEDLAGALREAGFVLTRTGIDEKAGIPSVSITVGAKP